MFISAFCAVSESRSVGQKQDDKGGDHNGEDDLFGLGDFTALNHFHLAHLVRCHKLHDGRLNQRDQSHIGISRNGNRSEQFRRKLGGQVDGRGAVGTADDADGSGLGTCEAQKHRTEEGDKHAQLRGGAEKQTLGVGEQRTEVRHGTDAHEDQRGINAGLHTDVEEVKKAAVGHDMPIAVIVGTGSVQKGFPQLRMVQGVVAHADKVAEVGEQTAEGNAAKQQRLELLHDPEVEQNKGNHDHDDVLPTAVCRKECGKTGLQREFLQDTQNIHMGLLMR